jgi:hypothetical protein
MKYLRDERGLDAEQLVLTGAEDEGDILLRLPAPFKDQRYVIEAKREKGFHLADWIKQAQVERDHYANHRNLFPEEVGFVVIHARRQHGIAKSYVTTTIDEWLERL